MNEEFYFALLELEIAEVEVAVKGGPGSGNFGHAGRPGQRGGSAPRSAAPAGAGATAAEKHKKAVSTLPNGAAKMSQRQKERAVRKLAKKPRKELQKRKKAVASHRSYARKQGDRTTEAILRTLERLIDAAGSSTGEAIDWLEAGGKSLKTGEEEDQLVAEILKWLDELIALEEEEEEA